MTQAATHRAARAVARADISCACVSEECAEYGCLAARERQEADDLEFEEEERLAA